MTAPQPTHHALQHQRHRRLIYREQIRKAGDREYDPDVALLRTFSDLFPRFTGHMVAQRSLDYAITLLHSDDRTYGTDDAGEANRIIRKILQYQDLRKDSDTRGNFFWMTHWDRVKDPNAVSFLCTGLVYAYLTFPDKLEDTTKAALERAFPEILIGIRGHKVRWQYTNIFFLNFGGLIALAKVLDDTSPHDEAVADFNTWLEKTSNDGIHEYNSPAYTPVSFFAMETAWTWTSDDRFRARVEKALDELNRQFALNICPNGFLAGAMSRAYPKNILHDAPSAYAHIKFGTPSPFAHQPPESCRGVSVTLFDYVPPDPIRQLALQKPDYAEIHERTVSINSRRTHVITPKYSIASQSMDSVGGHSPPPYILIVRHTEPAHYVIPFLPDESFLHQPCAAFHCRQDGMRVVGHLHYDLAVWRTNFKDAADTDQREKFLADPTFVCEPRFLLGFRDQIRETRVGNVDSAGGDIKLLPGQSLAVSFGDVFLGVVVTLFDDSRTPVNNNAMLAYGDDDRLRLHLRLYGGPHLRREDNPLDALVFVELHVPQADKTLATYADRLAAWQLTFTGTDRSFAARHPDGTTIAYPYTPDDPDPLGNALHRSPAATLNPSDLANRVNTPKEPRP